jgi:hypothetical protein
MKGAAARRGRGGVDTVGRAEARPCREKTRAGVTAGVSFRACWNLRNFLRPTAYVEPKLWPGRVA